MEKKIEFKRLGAAWKNTKAGNTYYSIKLDREVLEQEEFAQIESGVYMVENKFKNNDRQPDFILNYKVEI